MQLLVLCGGCSVSGCDVGGCSGRSGRLYRCCIVWRAVEQAAPTGLDVYNRVTSFIGTMLRDIQNTRLSDRDFDLDFHAIDADGDGQIS